MDFNDAMETFAEAWVAANTPTPVNSTVEPQNVKPGQSDDQPTTMSKEQIAAGRMPGAPPVGVTRPGVKIMPKSDAIAASSSDTSTSAGAKSIPIHCIVEQTKKHGGPAAATGGAPRGHSQEPVVELDTYAILPGATLFSEIVRTALVKIGYTASEAMGAKGAIQIKNWKPLTFDTVTENPNATVETILGDLTSVATVRIRLCSQSKLVAMEEVKEKLLNFLLQHSQNVLTTSGCPIGKNELKQITLGEFNPSLPEETREAFNKWYKEQTKGQVVPSTSPLSGSDPRSSAEGPARGSDNPMSLPLYSANRTRMRTSFDTDNEIPRLQKWFQENEHPSREQMQVYLHELNSLDSRRGRKPLDLTNIVYWFKNARAAQRRANKTLDTSNDEIRSEDHSMEVDENENETLNDHLSPATSPEPVEESVPDLPNRNAVYVVKPLEMIEDDMVIRIQPEDIEDPEKASTPNPENLGVPSSHNNRPAQSRTSTPVARLDLLLKEDNEQEEATDLSIRSRRDSSDSCATVSSLHLSHSSSSFRLNGNPLKREREEDDDASSNNTGTPSPPRVTPSQMQQLQAQQHALQMAAMSHALNLHYMHPASVYPTPMVNPPFPAVKNDRGYSPSHTPPSDLNNMSLSDKKKRSRVFIDPLTEIPRMEKWFLEDTHPSSYMIEKYTDELNRAPYRQRFPKLEPKNVQLWFKNHRAKVKRARLEMANNNNSELGHTDSYSYSSQPVKEVKDEGMASYGGQPTQAGRTDSYSQQPAQTV